MKASNKPLVDTLASFALSSTVETMPEEVLEDSKRVLLDSIGCALGGVDTLKGRAGIQTSRVIGGQATEAAIFGAGVSSSVYGAAFANGESINALDLDAVLPPGHVAPYVIPGPAAIAQSVKGSGALLVQSIAIGHEISHRMGKAMDYLRTLEGDEVIQPDVLGFAATVIGASAANSIVLSQDEDTTANALGIAAATGPVNAHRSWIEHVPSTSIKYTMAGPVVTAGLTAAYSAEFGHSGDREILDDADYGYARFIGTTRWEPRELLNELGSTWLFPASHSYKFYPHCRVTHAPLDAFVDLIEMHDLSAHEIDAVRCWGESWVKRPMWLTTKADSAHAAQMSIPYAFAAAAHRLPRNDEWYSQSSLNDSTLAAFMAKFSFEAHPDYQRALAADPSARPSRVEVDARGVTYHADRTHPKGSPTSDPSTYATTDELIEKFHRNAERIISEADADRLIEGIMRLEEIDDVSALLALTQGKNRTADSTPERR